MKARKTSRRAVKEAPQRWQKGRNCDSERFQPRPICISAVKGVTHHRKRHQAKSANEDRNDKVDGRVGAHSSRERNEQVEEADHAFDSDEQRQRLLSWRRVSSCATDDKGRTGKTRLADDISHEMQAARFSPQDVVVHDQRDQV